MKKVIFLILLVLASSALYADETFESQIISKEVQQVYGNGALSVSSDVYTILVLNKDAYMKIEVPKKAFDALKVGDVVRITFNRGLLYNDIKKIALVRSFTPN